VDMWARLSSLGAYDAAAALRSKLCKFGTEIISLSLSLSLSLSPKVFLQKRVSGV